jgi:hypothetical protein
MKTKMFLTILFAFILFLNLGFSAPTHLQDDSVSLLAPVASGQTLTVIHGYNDPLPNEACNIGTPPDHCNNQKYGLDLQPSNLSDMNILAPMPGVVNWIEGGCLGMHTGDNLNLTVCHFQSVLVSNQQTVVRGQVLGTRSDNWIHLSLDDRYNNPTAPYPPVAFNGSHTLEGFSFDPGADTARNQWLNQVISSTNNVVGNNGILSSSLSWLGPTWQSIQKSWNSFWNWILK